MQDLFDFILKMFTATLFLYFVNHFLLLDIPYDWFYLVIIAFLGIKGIIIVLLLYYFIL